MDEIASHIWQSTIVGAAAAVLALMFRNNSAQVRYWIWFAAAMKFLVPFSALSAVASRIPLPSPHPGAGEALTAAIVFRSSALSLSEAESAFVIGIWLTGAFTVILAWWWQWGRLAADARRSPPVTDGFVHDTLRRVERAAGIRTPTSIVTSGRSLEPGVFGIRKPVLMWPRHLTERLGPTHVEAIVTHEVCHIVRRDNLLASAHLVVSAVFWFHPLVWWIGARLVNERERACDERVIVLGQRPAIYAESILQTCRFCVASPLVNVAGVTGGHLKTRILRIMRNTPADPLGARKKILLVLATVLVGLVPIAAGVPGALPADRSAAAKASQDPNRDVERPGGNVTPPKLVRETKPEYSERAKQDKVQGEVLMECVVKADGTVGDKKIVKSLHPDLDQAALDAAAQWLFEPGTRDGKPVNVLVTIAMAFTLK